MFDFQLSLHFYAKDDEWRVHDSYGGYATARTISEIPDAVRVMLRSASERLARMAPEPEGTKS
jgi:hypothetical protein